jgi:hypothetical protein
VKNLEAGQAYIIRELKEIQTRWSELTKQPRNSEQFRSNNSCEFRDLTCSATQAGIIGLAPTRLRTAGSFVEGSITLTIPFTAFAAIPETLHLQKADCHSSTGCEPIPLPNLRSGLLPGPLSLTCVSGGYCQLVGDHLRSVDKIRLDGADGAHLFIANVGYNNVDFRLKGSKNLSPGQYNLFLIIGGIPVPAMQENEKKQLEQVRFKYPNDVPAK